MKEVPYVEVIAHDQHRRVTARALAFHLDNGKFTVTGSLSRLHSAEVGGDGVKDLPRATKHTRCRCANLHEVLANGFPEMTFRYR